MSEQTSIYYKLFEIGEKLVGQAKFAIPGVALFYLLAEVFEKFWTNLSDFVNGKIAEWSALVVTEMDKLGVDLTPPPALMSFAAKMNTIVPLAEGWDLLLLYLSFATVVLGLKWGRNLIPGMS